VKKVLFYYLENEELVENKLYFWDILFINDNIEIVYEKVQIKNKLKELWVSENFINEFNELKYKLFWLKRIDEAFRTLLKLDNQSKNQDTSCDLIYKFNWEIKKFSYRIAYKRQSIAIEWLQFWTIVIRLLMTKFFTLKELWISEYEWFLRKKILEKKLNIIWWETNSWKSTTIFSLLKEVYDANDWQIKLYTVEEPIEKQLWFVTQLEIQDWAWNENENFKFNDAERFLMRWDPDGILVWEIRDYDTANSALKFASTWHYTYATLHISNVFWPKDRFRAWGISEDSLAVLWFVEVTELVTRYENSKENQVYKLKEIFTKIDQNKLNEYIKELEKPLEEQNFSNFSKEEISLYNLIAQWDTTIQDLFNVFANNNKKDISLLWLKDIYHKYLMYLPSYFSNRNLDPELIKKKENIKLFLRFLFDKDKWWLDIFNESKTELFFKSIFLEWWEKYKEAVKHILLKFKTYLDEQKNLNQDKDKIFNDVKEFVLWKYITNEWVNLPFTFIQFYKFLLEQKVVLWKKTKWVTPIVEFFDYDEYELLKLWLKNVLFESTSFTPMVLFWLLKIQKINNQWKYVIDIRNILKMFKTVYKV